MKKQHLFIILSVVLLGFVFGIIQYYQALKTEDVSAVTVGIPNPGHSLAQLECSADSLCVDTTNNRVGIGTANPYRRLSVMGQAPIMSYTADYNNTNTGSTFVQEFGAATGNTYTMLGALTNGGSQWGNLILQLAGNVGIGTTSPNDKLDVSNGAIRWGTTSEPNLYYARSYFTGMGYGNANQTTLTFEVKSWPNSNAATPLVLTGAGNVGIGTTTPGGKLDVNGDIRFGTSTGTSTLMGNGIWTATDVKIRPFSDSNLGIDFYGTPGTEQGNLVFKGAGWSGDTTRQWIFRDVFNNGGTSVDRMIIDMFTGNVGIGTTSPGYTLTVAGTAWVTSGSWSGSDIRWKKSINTLSQSSSLEKVMSLNPVNYQWKTDEYPEMKFSSGTQLGFIAQDVEKIIPEVVTTNNEGYKGISYEKIVPVLTSAIQEQEKKIEQLKSIVCLDHPLAEVCK